MQKKKSKAKTAPAKSAAATTTSSVSKTTSSVKAKRLEKDCLDCSRYLSCKNESKNVNFICTKFRERETLELSDVFSFGSNDFLGGEDSTMDFSDVEGQKTKHTRDILLEIDKKINVSSLINSVLASDLLTPVDTKIDDSSVPMAKNFFEFTTGQKFLGVKPYLFQMLYIIQLFSEYCPRCSNLDWMKNGAKVDDSLATFSTKVICLNFGVCPNCGARKSDLVRSGELNYYQELAGLAGQRCLTSNAIVHTKTGLKFTKDFVSKDFVSGFNPLPYNTEILSPNLEYNTATSFYQSKESQTYTVVLKNGASLVATAEHPIKTVHGYMPVAALPNDVEIPCPYGFFGFGATTVSSVVAHFYGYYLSTGCGAKLLAPSHHSIKVAQAYYAETLTLEKNDLELPTSLDPQKIISEVMTFDRASTILFLRAFLTTTNCIDATLASLVLLQLQMLNIPSYYEQQKIFVDLDYKLRAEKLLGTKLPEGEQKFAGYRQEKNIFYIPLQGVTKAKVEVTYDFVVQKTESFLANGIDNHNSGKSAIVAMCCAYLLHKQIKLQKPNEIYGLLPANVLHGTFVALTYKQAAETLWEPFLSYITDSPWFCIEENSKITIQNGQKPIKDIVVGDLVQTLDGFSPVTSVFDNGVKQCYELTLANNAKVMSTADHKFCKVFDDGSFEWVPLNQLAVGDTIKTST